MMTNLIHDLRYGARILRKDLRFTTAVLATLALGIAANTAIFSVTYGVLLRALPYEDPDAIIVAHQLNLRSGVWGPTSPADFRDWREQNEVFDQVSAAEAWSPTLTGREYPERLFGLRASSNLFSLLGVGAHLGRGFLPQEDKPGSDRVVVLSFAVWQRRFGGSPDVIGERLTLDGELHTVVGVMPRRFRFPTFWATKVELWSPLVFLPERAEQRSGNSLRVFGRLRDGTSFTAAQANLSTVAARLSEQYPETNTNRGVRLDRLVDMTVREIKPTLLILTGAAAFLLLIACANVANLMLTRATARRREIAVRMAMGADRPRLVRQLLAEGALLSLAGGLLGVLAAGWIVAAILSAVPETPQFPLALREQISIDQNALIFSSVLSLLSLAVFGLVPALRASRLDLNESLKEGARTAGQLRAGRLRNTLVSAQVALAVILLTGAGLLVRSLLKLEAIDPGFQPAKVVSMVVPVTGSKFGTADQKGSFYLNLIERIRNLSGVESASMTNHIPLEGDVWGASFTLDGRPAPEKGNPNKAVYRVIGPEFFQTMGAVLLQGREFDAHDRENSPAVIVVNETLARRYWPSEAVLGKRLRLGSTGPWRTVVGVVKDLPQSRWAEVDNEIYLPFLQDDSYLRRTSAPFSMTIVARAFADPSLVTTAMRQEVWNFDANIPVSNVVTMEKAISNALWHPRYSALLLVTFASAAILLAALGIYGMISYSVSRQTREIGIRIAMGARSGHIARMVLGRGLVLTGFGVAAGLAGALALTRTLSSLLYGVAPTDPLTLAVVVASLVGVALLACYIPARQAATVDPMTALRYE